MQIDKPAFKPIKRQRIFSFEHSLISERK